MLEEYMRPASTGQPSTREHAPGACAGTKSRFRSKTPGVRGTRAASSGNDAFCAVRTSGRPMTARA
eukprot:11178796-Lingulodinium_polyedra.AAC.1